MDIKKYLEEKKDNLGKKAKQVALTGLAAATILGGVAGLTGCEQKDFSDINYFDIEQTDDISKMFESFISEFSQMRPDDPELQDFVTDEFAVIKSGETIVLQLIDYRDRDGDGENDGFRALNSVCNNEELANSLYDDLANFVDNENVTFEDSTYHISMNVFGDERYADLNKRLKDYFDEPQIFNLEGFSYRLKSSNNRKDSSDIELIP